MSGTIVTKLLYQEPVGRRRHQMHGEDDRMATSRRSLFAPATALPTLGPQRRLPATVCCVACLPCPAALSTILAQFSIFHAPANKNKKKTRTRTMTKQLQ